MLANLAPESLPRLVMNGRYRIDRLIGSGGAGAVYEAEQLSLHRTVAIKRLLPPRSNLDPHTGERFLREARVLAKLRHPGIVEIFDLVLDEDATPTIVMELLEGDNLQNVLAHSGGALAIGQSVRIAHDVAGALAFAHAAGVIHRDLKPSNVFLARGSRGIEIKLLDFGVSKLVGERDDAINTASGSIIGTPRYMSPEQALTASAIDARTDVFSLGSILYEMLCGVPPFESHTVVALLMEIVQKPHAPVRRIRPEVPPALEAVVDRCLAKSPDQRFRTMAELGHALAEVLAGVPQEQRTLALPVQSGASFPRAWPRQDENPDVVSGTLSGSPAPGGRLSSQEGPGLPPVAASGPAPAIPGSIGITQVGQAVVPPEFFRRDVFSESLFFANPSERYKRIEQTFGFYRDQLRHEYDELQGQVRITFRLWVGCVFFAFIAVMTGVSLALLGSIQTGTVTAVSGILLGFTQRAFQKREEHYRSHADQKRHHLRYGEQWLLAIQMIDALPDPAMRAARAERLLETLEKAMLLRDAGA